MRARACLMALGIALSAGPAGADEIWVAPTAQQDVGGIGVGTGGGIWASTLLGAVRMVWGVPGDLQAFQNARIVLIPQATAASTTLFVIVCRAQNADLATGSCGGPFPHPFSAVANQLVEIDVSTSIAPHVGNAGQNNIAIVAWTSPTTSTDHIVGLRFAYTPVIPANTATLGSNVFTGTQTAAAFLGSGADLTGVAKLSANTFTGTQTLADGNLVLSAGDIDLNGLTGEITKDGARFLHNIGINSVYAGVDAGRSATATQTLSQDNVGVGANALELNVIGRDQTAVGSHALANSTNGLNTAIGALALTNLSENSRSNTAVGFQALSNITDGAVENVALGANAGVGLTSGSNNLYLASVGVSTESNTIRIGTPSHDRAFIQGVFNVTTPGAGNQVLINPAGQLGTIASSRRYKEDIRDMGDTSARLERLRPVVFRYKQGEPDGSKPLQYGLIAEEVAEVFPELVVHGEDGRVESVQYHLLPALLLNELQQEQRRTKSLENQILDLAARLALLEAAAAEER